jgi:hypothetical protein
MIKLADDNPSHVYTYIVYNFKKDHPHIERMQSEIYLVLTSDDRHQNHGGHHYCLCNICQAGIQWMPWNVKGHSSKATKFACLKKEKYHWLSLLASTDGFLNSSNTLHVHVYKQTSLLRYSALFTPH